MATIFTKLHNPLLFVLALWFSAGTILHNNGPLIGMVSSLGINYGQLGSNLPPPERVAALLTSLKLTKVRIYDTNPEILKAFANTGIELIVTIENEMLATLSTPQQALQWVTARIKPFYPATRITDIAVGNEVYKGDGDVSLISNLVPAMSAIQSAMAELGLAQYIHLSTPHSLSVLSTSYPPSAGSFRPEIAPYMLQFLKFLSATGSPFWINAYPYFAYKSDPPRVSLDYALSNPSWTPAAGAVVDPNTRLKYDSMLYAQVDAVVFAMKAMGFGGVEVRVAETGWPSAGDQDEAGATVENAAAHNRNLLRRQMKEEGTPMRPGTRLEVYLFALFNEDLKPGPGSERNYGLYLPDETMVYNMGLSALSSTGTTTSSAGSAATSISLSSAATKVATTKGWKSVVYGVSVHLLAFKILSVRRLLLHI